MPGVATFRTKLFDFSQVLHINCKKFELRGPWSGTLGRQLGAPGSPGCWLGVLGAPGCKLEALGLPGYWLEALGLPGR